MGVVAGLLLAVIGGWLAIKLGSHWYASRSAEIDSHALNQKLAGLLRFGMPGAWLALVYVENGNRIVLRKKSEDGTEALHLEISGPGASEAAVERIASTLLALGEHLEWSRTVEPQHFVQQGPLKGRGINDEATLESVVRLAALELGHDPRARYRVEFEGPSDSDKIADYYGWKKRK